MNIACFALAGTKWVFIIDVVKIATQAAVENGIGAKCQAIVLAHRPA